MRTGPKTTRTGVISLLILLFTVINYFYNLETRPLAHESAVQVQQAFANKESEIQVRGRGVIINVLKDDLKGARHQRIIVQVAQDQTILIAHNIDLAPRIDTIKKDEKISFWGVYEWNTKGGIVHWTHHDPQKRHIDGWLKYHGKIYQ